MQPLVSALPPKPQLPKDYDCCGGGCADCELKIYLRELAEWKKLEMAFLATRNSAENQAP